MSSFEGVLVPRPRMEPGPPAVGAWSPNRWSARDGPEASRSNGLREALQGWAACHLVKRRFCGRPRQVDRFLRQKAGRARSREPEKGRTVFLGDRAASGQMTPLGHRDYRLADAGTSLGGRASGEVSCPGPGAHCEQTLPCNGLSRRTTFCCRSQRPET